MDDSEAKVLQDIRLELGTCDDMRLFRNTVGGHWTKHGKFMRTGLAPGSADLIGITSITITPDMVGKKVGVFTSIEAKRGKGGTVGMRQTRWCNMVRKLGGIAGFASCVDDAWHLIRTYDP